MRFLHSSLSFSGSRFLLGRVIGEEDPWGGGPKTLQPLAPPLTQYGSRWASTWTQAGQWGWGGGCGALRAPWVPDPGLAQPSLPGGLGEDGRRHSRQGLSACMWGGGATPRLWVSPKLRGSRDTCVNTEGALHLEGKNPHSPRSWKGGLALGVRGGARRGQGLGGRTPGEAPQGGWEK